MERGAFSPRAWSEDFVREMMGDPEVRTLVVEDGVLIAYAMVRVSPAHEMAEVMSLVVSPPRRRQGLGRELMRLLEQVARDGGARAIMLCVRPDNRAAINLYLFQGYNVLARNRGYYEDGSDACMMVKQLGE